MPGSIKVVDSWAMVAWVRQKQAAPNCPPFLLDADALGYCRGMELIFEIRDADEGGLCARALGHSIFTEAETWEDLRANVLEAASLHFEEAAVRPRNVRLHYVKDELIPVQSA